MVVLGRKAASGKSARLHRARTSLFRLSNLLLFVLFFCAGLTVRRLRHYVGGGTAKKERGGASLDSPLQSSALRGVGNEVGSLGRKARGEGRKPADLLAVTRSPRLEVVRKSVTAVKGAVLGAADVGDVSALQAHARVPSTTVTAVAAVAAGEPASEATAQVPTLAAAPLSSTRTLAPGPIVIDAFPFHHEYDMLELRLHEL